MEERSILSFCCSFPEQIKSHYCGWILGTTEDSPLLQFDRNASNSTLIQPFGGFHSELNLSSNFRGIHLRI